MWYATETVFIDGKLFGTRVCKGCCYASHDEEPQNSCEKKFDDRIKIYTDWFETRELAQQYCDGEITYQHIYDAYYDVCLKFTRTRFKERKIIQVDESKGILPHVGIYTKEMHSEKPWWVV